MTEFTPKIVRTTSLTQFKLDQQKFSMLTSYDRMTAEIFDTAGIDVLLVGDSIGTNQLGHSDPTEVTLDEMVSATRAVRSGAKRALVVADMPFGSYESSTSQAVDSAVTLVKAGGAHAVKLEGGMRQAHTIKAITDAGIAVMGHIGFTPQSMQQLGGYKVQGRGDSSVKLIGDAMAVAGAGAFAVVIEMTPPEVAADITAALTIPTIGIGAGNVTDGQVLVWTDFAGMSGGPVPSFVKQYANIRESLLTAATAYRQDVVSGNYPDKDHSFN